MEGPVRNKDYQETYERWDEARQKLSSFYAMCKEMYRLYASYANRQNLPYTNKLDMPLGFKIIETLIPYLVSQMPDPGCTPDTMNDQRAAMRMNAKMKHYLGHPIHLLNMANWYRDGLQYGTGIVKDGWRYKQRMTKRWVYSEQEVLEAYSYLNVEPLPPEFVIQLAKDGKIPGIEYVESRGTFAIADMTSEDRPHFEPISPLDCAWIGNSDNVQDLEAFYHTIYKTEYEIKDMLKRSNKRESDYYNMQYVLDHASQEITNTVMLQNEIKLIDAKNDSFSFVEQWSRIDGVVWITTFSKSAECIVRQRKSPYFHGQYPFSIIRTFGRGRELIGTPILKWVESLIMAVVKLSNEILENGSLAVNRPFLKRPGAKFKQQTLALVAGKIIPARPDDLKQLEISDVRPATLNMLNMFIGFLESITDVDNISRNQGVPSTPNTAGGVEALQFQSTSRIRLQQYLDTIGMADLFTRVASNIDQYKDEPVDLQIPTEGGIIKNARIQPQDTRGNYKFIPDVRSMLATNNSVARAQLQSLLNVMVGLQETYKDENGQLSPKLIGDKKYILKKILSTYDVIDNPQKALMDPNDVRAIPVDKLPPPMPPQGGGPAGGPTGRPGMETATGTNGMPPQLGGTQQPGVMSPNQMPMPKRPEDAIRSAMSIQQ